MASPSRQLPTNAFDCLGGFGFAPGSGRGEIIASTSVVRISGILQLIVAANTLLTSTVKRRAKEQAVCDRTSQTPSYALRQPVSPLVAEIPGMPPKGKGGDAKGGKGDAKGAKGAKAAGGKGGGEEASDSKGGKQAKGGTAVKVSESSLGQVP